MSSFLDRVKQTGGRVTQTVGERVRQTVGERVGGYGVGVGGGGAAKPDEEKHSHTHLGHNCTHQHRQNPEQHTSNRYDSFAAESSGNVKWYVDGCSYFWAVSEALERAQEEIFIMDWWLSPELYLRRPPSQNEKYRLDKMLQAAAERGVKVHVIVYREVEAALSCNSAHTRKALEALHPNIQVFRHPDHTPTGYDLASELGKSFTHLTNYDLAKASGEAIKALYGTTNGMVLFWAHHEKLLVVDRKIGFMGGLDLCFGRWDTSSHPIADAHPGDLDAIIFPGQDYNNARVYDFHDVGNWNQNKLDRTKSSRMGWSDVSLSMNGPIVNDMVSHFLQRWNYILEVKYRKKRNGRVYEELHQKDPVRGQVQAQHASSDPRVQQASEAIEQITSHFTKGMDKFLKFGQHAYDQYQQGQGHPQHGQSQHESNVNSSGMKIQLTRSSSKWSSGKDTEHSIANAYADAISKAKHFIYIENQFFITATSDDQRPIENKLGAAIVDRIVRAHENRQRFKVWVVMPAVPAFAGDLKSDAALGTRAIMEFQYFSISRGGHSIIETLQKNGINPKDYIGFYNLRNYDRINTSKTMRDAEGRGGVSYEAGRKGHDQRFGDYPEEGRVKDYQGYQKGAAGVEDTTMDTISSCYMNGPRVTDVYWDGNSEDEMNAFVSEELYVHSKLLIADDQVVICGSANLNDRSQLGSHDSEIAVIIEDSHPNLETNMNGQRFTASRFAASLRRYIFRKHLGLIGDQRWDQPNQNFHPVDTSGNMYDWGSRQDGMVADPLSNDFLGLWSNTARTNTEIFSKAFHPVPNDKVRNWKDYETFFSECFIVPGAENKEGEGKSGGKVQYGHIVPKEFPGGVRQVKESLAGIRGTLVDMPLDFLVEEDIAKEGLQLNRLIEVLYT